MIRHGKIWGTILTLGVGVLLLTWTRSVDFSQVWSALTQVGPKFFLMALGLSLVQITLQSSRLWALIPSALPLSWTKVAQAFVYGQFVNTFTPARAGDAAKVVWLQKDEPLTIAHATGTILADKVVDITALVLLIISVGIPLSPLRSTLPQLGEHPWMVGAIALLVLTLLVGISIKISAVRQWMARLFVGMSGLLKPWPLTLSLIFGIGVWLAEALVIWILSGSQGFILTGEKVLWVLVILNLGIAIPVAFANLGVFEAAMVFGLTQVGVSLESALVIAVIHHGTQLLSIFVALAGVRLFPKRVPTSDQRLSSFHVQSEDKHKSHQYYQALSQNYETHVNRGLFQRLRERERSAILELAALEDSPKRMIDVGCGSGFYIREAKKWGWWTCAMDVVPEFVTQLETQSDAQIVSDIESLSTDTTYDLVMCTGVLDFVVDPHQALTRLCQLVAPQGRLVIHVPRQGLGGWYYRLEKKIEKNMRVNLFTEAWCKSVANRHGLRWTKTRTPLPNNMTLAFEKNS